MNPNHDFKIKPSIFYILLLMPVIAASLIITFLLPVANWIKWPMLVLFALYSVNLLRHHAFLRSGDAVVTLNKLDKKRWQVITRSATYKATLLGDSIVTQFVSVLRFAVPERRAPLVCIVWKDSLPAGEYRQLVVQIKT